jgi:hypothetical protein
MTASTPRVATDSPAPLDPVARPVAAMDGPQVLTDLREVMNRARAAVMVARRPPVVPLQLSAARGDYLTAMLAYEQALTAFRLPVPHRLRDEARLLRRLTFRT